MTNELLEETNEIVEKLTNFIKDEMKDFITPWYVKLDALEIRLEVLENKVMQLGMDNNALHGRILGLEEKNEDWYHNIVFKRINEIERRLHLQQFPEKE